MDAQKFHYLYGPVHSWRLGVSLGIDPLSDKSKICNMDCIYCQLGRSADLTHERKVYVPTENILAELRALPEMHLDYLTFSGRGEPTLALNLGEMIAGIRAERTEGVAVITNSLLLTEPDVRRDVAGADFVLAKLDACDQETLMRVDKAVAGVSFAWVVDGILAFRQAFRGRLALQIMFMDANAACAPQLAALARRIQADEIELNTPLRPSGIRPLSMAALEELKGHFRGLPVKTVYEMEQKTVTPLDETDTIRRHGNYKKTAPRR